MARSTARLRTLALLTLAAGSLLGCGPEVVGAAAGGAAAAAANAKQAQEQKAKAEEQVKAIEKAQQERLDSLDKQADHAAQ